MKIPAFLVALSASISLPACGSTEGSTPDGEWRKRAYVVEVDTPQGMVSGRSIVANRFDCGYSFPQGRICSESYKMEAAAVDLPNGETLYMTVTQAMPFFGGFAWDDSKSTEFTRTFDRNMLPNFVMFKDESDPTTIYEIDPEKEFGNGYTIRQAYINLDTDEEITNNIPKRLPWLNGMKGMISGSTIRSFHGNILDRYGPGDFTG